MESLLAVLLLTVSVCNAVIIDGTAVSMDAAIKAAGGNETEKFLKDADTVLVELDILYKIDTYLELKQEQIQDSEAASGGRVKRKAIMPESRYRWTDKTVPYEISRDFSNEEVKIINSAITDYHFYTCIRMRPATSSDRNKVSFVKGTGCSSYVGMIGGAQPISLGRGCVHKEIVIHEIGHAVGFQHEQTRTDRDGFVTILHQNVNPRMLFNFQKYTSSQVSSYGVPYDYTSVMHYGQYAFSNNGQRTIVARDSRYQEVMGKSPGFSYNDIKLANTIYQCAAKCAPKRCPEGAFQGRNCACWCNSGDKNRPFRVCRELPSSASDPAGSPLRPAVCKDKRIFCRFWAKYCDNSIIGDRVKENCRKSCGLC